jgi:hypothetical protein
VAKTSIEKLKIEKNQKMRILQQNIFIFRILANFGRKKPLVVLKKLK